MASMEPGRGLLQWIDLGRGLLQWIDLGRGLLQWIDLGRGLLQWVDLGCDLLQWIAKLSLIAGVNAVTSTATQAANRQSAILVLPA